METAVLTEMSLVTLIALGSFVVVTCHPSHPLVPNFIAHPLPTSRSRGRKNPRVRTLTHPGMKDRFRDSNRLDAEDEHEEELEEERRDAREDDWQERRRRMEWEKERKYRKRMQSRWSFGGSWST